MKLEIVVENYSEFEAILSYNVDRIELVTALDLGGLTPQYSFIQKCIQKFENIHIMLRPRQGNFCYNDYDKDLILNDLKLVNSLGVKGIVFGALNKNNTLDQKFISEVVKESKDANLEVTLNRAFDFCEKQENGLDFLTSLKVDRILTAGCKTNITDGYKNISANLKYLKEINSDLKLVAAGAVNEKNVLPLLKLDVEGIHIHVRKLIKTSVFFGNEYLVDLKKIDRIEKMIPRNKF